MIERMGMFVQVWWIVDGEVTGKAKEMAQQTVQIREEYMRRLYVLRHLFWEYAAKGLGYTNIPITTRRRQSEVLEEV